MAIIKLGAGHKYKFTSSGSNLQFKEGTDNPLGLTIASGGLQSHGNLEIISGSAIFDGPISASNAVRLTGLGGTYPSTGNVKTVYVQEDGTMQLGVIGSGTVDSSSGNIFTSDGNLVASRQLGLVNSNLSFMPGAIGSGTATLFIGGDASYDNKIGINTATPGEALEVIGTISSSADIYAGGDIFCEGIVTADEFHTTIVSTSVQYSTGNSEFGDESTDVHKFTGSIEVSGNLTVTDDDSYFHGMVSMSALSASLGLKAGGTGSFEAGEFTGRVQLSDRLFIGEAATSQSGAGHASDTYIQVSASGAHAFINVGTDDNTKSAGINFHTMRTSNHGGSRIFKSGSQTYYDHDESAIFRHNNAIGFRIDGSRNIRFISGSFWGVQEATYLYGDAINQRIGIGTTSPSSKLDIVTTGEAGLEVSVDTGHPAAVFSTALDYVARFESTDAGSGIVIADSNSGTNYNRIGVTTNDMTFTTNNVEKLSISADGIISASGHISASGNIIIEGGLVVDNSTILRKYTPGWTNAPNHDIIYTGWLANTGDYMSFKAAGNSTSGHGVMMIGDDLFAIGKTNVETASPVADSATAPFNEENWLLADSSGLTVDGNITASADISGSGTGSFSGGGIFGLHSAVGIGTISPIYTLDVEGRNGINSVARFKSTNDKALIIIEDDDTAFSLISKDAKFHIGTGSTDYENFTVWPTQKRVGINTTAPDKPLHVISSDDTPFRVESSDGLTGISFKDNSDDNAIYYSGANDAFYVPTKIALGNTPTGITSESLDIYGGLAMSETPSIGTRRILYMGGETETRGPFNPIVGAIQKSGKCLFLDKEFADGKNDVQVYNNAGSGYVSHSWQPWSQQLADDFFGFSPNGASLTGSVAPNGSGNVIQITYDGGAAVPGDGGFYQVYTGEGKTVVQVFQALIPEGRYLTLAENSQGRDKDSYWLTNTMGTGKWEWYARVNHVGSYELEGHSFSSAGHVYLDEAGPATVWYLASCTAYDMTDQDVDVYRRVGIGTIDPENTLHVKDGDSGQTPDVGYQLTVENSAIAGIEILGGTGHSSRVTFGDSGNGSIGMIKYDHTTDNMFFRTNGTEHTHITSTGIISTSNDIIIESSDPTLYFKDTDGTYNGYVGASNEILYLRGNASGQDVEIRSTNYDNAIFVDDSTQRVGIGLNNPESTLSILGDISASGTIYAARFESSGSATKIDIVDDMIITGSILANGSGSFTNITASLDGVHVSGSVDIILENGPAAFIKTKIGSSDEYHLRNDGDAFQLYNETDDRKEWVADGAGGIGIGVATPHANGFALQVSGAIGTFGDNEHALGTKAVRFSDVFAVQTTVGAIFETGLATEGIGELETGTIVVWKNGKLVASYKEQDKMVMGVTQEGKDEPIILGAEPILVTGEVKEGDFLTTSDKIGHAKAQPDEYLLRTGTVIAQALESSNGESNLIKGMIRKL
jgi:hypothetical protein